MNKITPVESVAIIGGGTSGWLAAAYMSYKFPERSFTVVDKEQSRPIGVGEATLLGFQQIMYQCGFSPEEWFTEIDTTFKAGILFPGWGEHESDVWHPFGFHNFEKKDQEPKVSLVDIWSQHKHLNFNEYGLTLYDLSVNHNKIHTENINNYALHIDASKLVTFLKRELVKRKNVTSVDSEVIEVNRDSLDNVTNLKLLNETTITADLYIDCTGFKKVLGRDPEKVTLDGRLFCDTAIAAHVPYDDVDTEQVPYVISEQVDHGWVWKIPVQSRIGSGLVFNRSITDIEEAKDYFIKHWDNRISKDDLTVIDWTPHYNKNIWDNNVVSIGLSAGFIEPLESTGIALIIVGIEQLAFMLEPGYYTTKKQDYYNGLMEQYFNDAIDFVSMHYARSNKDTPFWNWVKDTYIQSEQHKFYEKQMQRTDRPLPTAGSGLFFGGLNWLIWMHSMGYTIGTSRMGFSSDEALYHLTTIHQIQKDLIRKMPTHPEYINYVNDEMST